MGDSREIADGSPGVQALLLRNGVGLEALRIHQLVLFRMLLVLHSLVDVCSFADDLQIRHGQTISPLRLGRLFLGVHVHGLGHLYVAAHRFDVSSLGGRSWNRHCRIRVDETRGPISREVVRLILGIGAISSGLLENAIHRDHGSVVLIMLRVQRRVRWPEPERILLVGHALAHGLEGAAVCVVVGWLVSLTDEFLLFVRLHDLAERGLVVASVQLGVGVHLDAGAELPRVSLSVDVSD